MKDIKISTTTTLISAILLYLELNSIVSIGKTVNKYFPCQQNQTDSFPCFGIYDVYLMLILIIIFVASLVIIIYKMIKKNSKRKNV